MNRIYFEALMVTIKTEKKLGAIFFLFIAKIFIFKLNPFNAIGNFGFHLNFTQLLDERVA